MSRTRSSAGEDAGSDGAVLSVLGHDLIDAGAETEGGSASSTTGFLHETCAVSGGVVCLALLYGHAHSTAGDGSSSSSAYTAVASACVGGDQDRAETECDGPISAAVAQSRSSARDDGARASSEQSSTLARTCLGGTEGDVCEGIGLVLFEGSASSDGSSSGAALRFQAGGEERFTLNHPDTVPSDCEPDASPVCADLNRASATGGAGTATAQDDPPPGFASARADGHVVELRVAGNEIIRIGATSARTSSDGASSDATVLSVLGHEVVGAHSSTSGGASASETGYLTETCGATEGQVCVALLYGRAESSEDAASSRGSSDAAVLRACVGGRQNRPDQACDGPVSLALIESSSEASQDKGSGAAEATQSTDGARFCLGGENADTGACDGLGAGVLSARSHSAAAPGEKGTSEGEASVVTVAAGGEEIVSLDQPRQVAIPPGCPGEGSLVCLTLNQVNTAAEAGHAASDATVVGVDVLPDNDLVGGSGSNAGTSATAAPLTEVLGESIQRRPADVGGLAVTGLRLLQLLALAMLLLVAGALFRIRAHRRFQLQR